MTEPMTPPPVPADVVISDVVRQAVIAEHQAERRDTLANRGVKAALVGAVAVFAGFNVYMHNDIQETPSGLDSEITENGSRLDSTFTGSLFEAEVVVQKDANGNLPENPQKLRADLSPKGVKVALLAVGDLSVLGLGFGLNRKNKRDKAAAAKAAAAKVPVV